MKKAALSLALASLALAGCGSSSSSSPTATSASNAAHTSNTTAASTAAVCPHNPVRFAVEPYDTGPALEAAYKSLARDLAALLSAGYRIERMALVDLFPQTYHLETVVRLVLAG